MSSQENATHGVDASSSNRASQQPNLFHSLAKNASNNPASQFPFHYQTFPVAQLIQGSVPNSPASFSPATYQHQQQQPIQIQPIRTQSSSIFAASSLPGTPSTPPVSVSSTKSKSNPTRGASSATSTISNQDSASQQQQQDFSFKSLFTKYQKKRSRNQLYNTGSNGEMNEIDEKFEFMAQIISLQASKIRRLENRLQVIEEILPDYGSFSAEEKQRYAASVAQLAISTGLVDGSIQQDGSKKEKRPKTDYQIFMSEEIPRIRSQNPDIPQKEAFSVAAKNWSLKKEAEQKEKEASTKQEPSRDISHASQVSILNDLAPDQMQELHQYAQQIPSSVFPSDTQQQNLGAIQFMPVQNMKPRQQQQYQPSQQQQPPQ
jgi:hypothetical protein